MRLMREFIYLRKYKRDCQRRADANLKKKNLKVMYRVFKNIKKTILFEQEWLYNVQFELRFFEKLKEVMTVLRQNAKESKV